MRKVLVCNSSMFVRNAIQVAIKTKHGVESDTVEDAHSALKTLERSSADYVLLIVDAEDPGVISLLDQVEKDYINIRAIVLSESERNDEFGPGVFYIKKPIDYEYLVEIVSYFLVR